MKLELDSPLTPYRIINSVFALLMLAWCIAYGYANYQIGKCNQALADMSTRDQARMNVVHERLSKDAVRSANVQAQVDAVAKKFNGPQTGEH